MEHAPPRLLDTKQVAEILRTTVEAVQTLCRRRQLPHIKVGRRTLVDAAELAAWIDTRRVAVRDFRAGAGRPRLVRSGGGGG